MTNNEILYGAAYYDEYMPYDRIKTDMQMMKDAGMNVIRIAESTWSTWEPQEGVFDFTHLHRMLDCAVKYDMKVIIGTPTYAIPSWLAKKYPDIIAVTHNGQELYGHRQNMDITNPHYLHHAEIIIEKLMEEVKDYDCVIGFQLDNETKSYDTCTVYAQKKFIDYLKNKWPDIKEFNHEFGLDYWSNRVDNWDDFPDIRGTINMSLDAEYKKFQRSLVSDFLAWQSGIVKKYKRPDQFITQNFDFEWHDYSFGLQPEVNQYEAVQCLDIAGCDIYHPSQDSLTGREITVCGNIARGLKGTNYLVLETEAAGNHPWLPYPGQLRLQAVSHIANGANMVEYWHWHSIHNAIESYWKGVLSHDLKPNRLYRECCVIGNEFKKFGNQIVNLKKNNHFAVIADNASLTGLNEFKLNNESDTNYNSIFRWLCDTLYLLNIEYDVIPADPAQFVNYDNILVPALYSASDEVLLALDSFVQNGGNLIVTFKSCFSDGHLKIHSDVQPYILNKALGITYDEFTLPVNVNVTFNGVTSAAKDWMEMVNTTTAKALCTYEHKVWNAAAVTENSYGKGRAMYLGTYFGEDTLLEIFKYFFKTDGFDKDFHAAYPVVVKRGINNDGCNVSFLLNYSNDTQNVTCNTASYKSLTDDTIISAGQTISLKPWDICILLES